MSLLKTIDPSTNQVSEPPAADPRVAFREAVQRVEDAFTVALKGAEDRAATFEATLSSLRKEHDAALARLADAEKKVALLAELKAKLQAL